MDISVIGAGAMGMLFGGYLSAKHNVTMIGRNAQKTDNIAKNGITIRETSGEERTYCLPNRAHPRRLLKKTRHL